MSGDVFSNKCVCTVQKFGSACRRTINKEWALPTEPFPQYHAVALSCKSPKKCKVLYYRTGQISCVIVKRTKKKYMHLRKIVQVFALLCETNTIKSNDLWSKVAGSSWGLCSIFAGDCWRRKEPFYQGWLIFQAWLQDAVESETLSCCFSVCFEKDLFVGGDWLLVLGMKPGEHVMIGDDIMVKVVRSERGDLRLAIDAPADVKITRGELKDSPQSHAPK
jgi:carbon storage regulator